MVSECVNGRSGLERDLQLWGCRCGGSYSTSDTRIGREIQQCFSPERRLCCGCTCASGSPNDVVGDATIISLPTMRITSISFLNQSRATHQFKPISNPPPSANPFTAAIIGFFPLVLQLTPLNPPGGCLRSAMGVDGSLRNWACSMRSWPAQKAFLPEPVMIRQRREGLES